MSVKVVNRRDLIKGLCTSAAAVPVLAAAGSTAKSAPGSAKNMRVSLAAYSVRRALTSGQMDLFGFIDWCSEMNLAGTELTSYYFEEGFDSGYLRRLRNHAFRQGVTVSGTAIRNTFCLPPGPRKDKEVADVKKWIDYASDLFAPHVRIFAGDVPEGADTSVAIGWTADGVKSVLDHAEKRGVIVGLENHGGITTLAEDLIEICKQVGDHPWFGVNLDTGNYGKEPYAEIKMTAPLAVNVQVKVEIHDGEERVPTDMERIRDIVVESGYKGWVALEYEAEADPFVEVPRYIKKLKELYES